MENPKIRFKGFTKDWEQRKLSEIAIEKLSNGIMNNQANDETGLRHINVINMYELDKIHPEKLTFSNYDEDAVKKCNVEWGDIFLTRSSLKPEGIAESNVLLDSGRFVYDDHLIRLKLDKEKYDPFFVKLNLSGSIFKRQFIARAKTTAFTTIGQEDIAECFGLFPEKEEQEKIGTYFSNLDHLITLHQRKCEQTKKLKKYMLQKMFPQNGAKVPEIRFDGFTYDWEQRKLSDVLDIVTKRNGEKYGKEEVLSVSDEYGCINQIKFQGRSFAGEDISNYKIVDTGDIIYTRSPLKSKPYGIIKVVGDEIGIVSPLYIVNKVKEGNNSQFIYRVFDSPEKTNKYLSPLVRKGAKNTMNISNDEWLSGKIDVAPSYEEQYQIGLYFDHLDHFITLHQRKCDELKKMKKYMLQNMFI